MKHSLIIVALTLFIFGCNGSGSDAGIDAPNGTAGPVIPDDVPGEITGNASSGSFEECVDSGNPVMESFPRQCRDGNGNLFVSLSDLFQVSLDPACISDADCIIVNRDAGFSCCTENACGDEWLSVNAGWHEKGRETFCPGCPMACAPPQDLVPGCIENICTIADAGNGGKTDDSGNLLNETSGFAFGNSSYLLVLDDVVLAGDRECGAFTIRYMKNSSGIEKLAICEKDSREWLSPDGKTYRILVKELGAGYTGSFFADIIIYG